ncbi:MAG TPA: GNAT family N-acetyltransferase [Draconibacterium sp.]|nr:GNAT family N-acetyltransferase [Draconibacterium sp.]
MIFNTNRLFLRPVNIEDKASIYKYRSDHETDRYQSSGIHTMDDMDDFFDKISSEINIPGTWFQFAIIERDSNLLIGDIGVHFLETSDNRQVEIGYTLDKNFRGKGYAREALTKIIDYLITHLNKHRIIASIDPENTDSIKLIERIGFRKEAHFVESLFLQGKWVDDVIYAMLAREWGS